MPVSDPSGRSTTAADVSTLEALENVAAEAGFSALVEEARSVAARISSGLFYVVCLGEFKRGKSTLLNALVGREILPAGVVPVTSAVTILRYGSAVDARVRLSGGEVRHISLAEIPDYVTEEKNPENRRGLLAVEVDLPSPLVASGMCLVDTPGVGSVFAGNTAATRAFLPHVDAALVVLGADPPLSADELALVEEASRGVPHLLFVLNKADRLPDAECVEAARFAERILASRLTRPVSLLSVSATERLRGEGPERDWNRLVQALATLARDAGAELVCSAAARAARRLSRRLLQEIEEQRGALLRPLEESERRLADLERALADATRALGDLDHLLAAEEGRLAARYRADRDAFLARALPGAQRELRLACERTPGGPGLREALAEAARAIAQTELDSWGEVERPAAEALYREGAGRFVEMGNDFLVRSLGAEEPAVDEEEATLGRESGFRERSRFQFAELLAVSEPAPVVRALDVLRPRRALRAAAVRDASAYLERLLASNSARVQNDLIDLVRVSRRKLQEEIRSRVSRAVRSASAALERATKRQAEGEASVRAELRRLDDLTRRAEILRITAT